MGFASSLAKWSSGKFPGAMITLDTLPPLFLGFPFAPSEIRDDFGSELETVTSPGNRYHYPVLKGGKARIISFRLHFDARYPVTFGDPALLGKQFQKAGNDLLGSRVQAQHVATAIAVLEKLKLPKQGIAKTLQSVTGNFTKVNPGASDPAPPLTLLILNPFKMMVGYVSQAEINQIRFNKYMFCTRADAHIRFMVSPDMIFTTVEDVIREVDALIGWVS